MIETITFLGSPSTIASKTWRREECVDYQMPLGPFGVQVIAVADLDALASLVTACPPNAFIVRGAPVEEGPSIPFRRHRPSAEGGPSLKAQAHRWIAIDYDREGPTPRVDLATYAAEARASLPPAFVSARCLCVATSSAGIKPGARLRMWFWCSRLVTDADAKAWLGGTPGVDLSLFTPSQPCYAAPPRFDGRPDPFAKAPRHVWLEGEPVVQVPASFEIASPMTAFGPAVASAMPGNRNTNLTSIAGAMRRKGLDADAIHAALEKHNTTLLEPLPSSEVAKIATGMERYEPEALLEVAAPLAPPAVTESDRKKAERLLNKVVSRVIDDPAGWRTHLEAMAKPLASSWITPDIVGSRVARAFGDSEIAVTVSREEVVGVAVSLAGSPVPPVAVKAPAWMENAIVSEEGALIPCAENLSLLLRGHSGFDLWLNTRAGRPYWTTCPWRPSGVQISDGDNFQMLCWLSRTVGWHKPPCDLLAALAEIAAAKPWDPWRGYLEGLAWDRTQRLETAAPRLLGTEEGRTAGVMFARWMISAVARTFEPGCQADHMLVLEGDQGEGKTTFLRDLAMDPAFFTRLGATSDLGGVRTIGKIHGPVIVEIAELDSVRKTSVEAVKQFVDERIDRVQWLYSRTPVDVKRTCVFAGTANDREYLRDVTGNRRFWPIACGRIDRPAVLTEREQLWAEAVALYKAGARWWPTKAESEDLGLDELQESRRAVGAVEEALREVLEMTYTPGKHLLLGFPVHVEQLRNGRLQWVTTGQACKLAGGVKDHEAQAALRAMGWRTGRVRADGLQSGRVYAYHRPEKKVARAEVLRPEEP